MDKKSVLELFTELTKIDSPSGEESEMGKFVMKYLEQLGLSPVRDNFGNIFAATKNNVNPVLISAHLDTVEPGRGVSPKLVNGKVVSSGDTILGADNKAAVAAILYALSKVKKTRDLEILFTVREETDSGVKDFDFAKIRSKEGLIADRATPLGAVVLASPFIENIYIEVFGKGAHAGVPEKGINALTIISNAISSIKWGRISKNTTSNIGLISGGTAMNSVPDRISLTGEARSFIEDELIKQVSVIKNAFNKAIVGTGAKMVFESSRYCSGYVYKKDDNQIKELSKLLSKFGLKTRFEIAFGGSDANCFHEKGIKVVNIGDATKNPHTVKESIKVSDLEKLSDIFSEYIKG